MENALLSKSSDSALCNLLLFMLDSIFKCYDEETFEETGADSENEAKDDEVHDGDAGEYQDLTLIYDKEVKFWDFRGGKCRETLPEAIGLGRRARVDGAAGWEL